MFTSISRIQQLGYQPDRVLDIGACVGNWTMECLKNFPNAKYDLFEAIPYSYLKSRYQGINKITVHTAVLDSVEREVDWYEMKNTGDSMYKEKTRHFTNCAPVKKQTTTLSKIIEHNGTDRFFIKIDCQGAEIPILKGCSTELLKQTDFIILEIPFFGQWNENVPNFLEHIQFMNSIGFIVYDIADTHYVNHFNIQVDIIFINKNHRFNQLIEEKIMNC